MVLEVDLYYLITKSEHNGMPRPHPLLHVNNIFYLSYFLSRTFGGVFIYHSLWLFISFKVAPEVLEKGNLLLELFWVFCEGVVAAYILTVT